MVLYGNFGRSFGAVAISLHTLHFSTGCVFGVPRVYFVKGCSYQKKSSKDHLVKVGVGKII